MAATVVRTAGVAAATAAAPVREVLANGLTVIAEERRTADTVALELTARAGARDDGDLPGVNLLTSRVMFQGTSRRPSETELQRAAAQVGGTLSRGTGLELSSFTSRMPAREVSLGFDLLAGLVLEPLLDEGALARQKQITLQDLGRSRSEPGSLLSDLFQEAIFPGHPVGRRIIGTEQGIESLTREDLLDARQRFWSAANLVLTVIGRIGVREAIARAQQYFGDLPSGSANERRPASLPPLASAQTVRGEAGQQQAQFRLGFQAAGLLEADRYPLVVLNALMAGASGRLFKELRTERGLAYSAGAGYVAYTDAGAWFTAAGVDPQNVDTALEVVRAEVGRLRDEPPDAGEVASKISQIAGQQILADEGNAARASRLASQEILGTEPTEEFVRRIRQVIPADVQRVAQTYLDPDRALLVVVGPGTG
jgi:predicted Zn-dependent peptidase